MPASDDGPAMQATRLCAVPEGAASAAQEGQMEVLHALPGARVAISRVEVSNSLQQQAENSSETTVVSTSDSIALSHEDGLVSPVQCLASSQLGFAASNDCGQVFVSSWSERRAHLRNTGKEPCEQSYSHVSFAASGQSLLCTRLIQRDSLVLDPRSEGPPTARFEHELAAMGNTAMGECVWGVLEYGDLTVWDARAAKPLVTRMAANRFGAGDVFYCIDAFDNHVTMGGAARIVFRVDKRKWSVVDTWKTPLKHDVVGVKLNGSSNQVACLGLDHELAVHTWGQASDASSRLDLNHHHVLRSRARWMGAVWVAMDQIAKQGPQVVGRDVLGNVYTVKQ